MESIFSPKGRAALAKLGNEALYAFDFDGTLTPYFKDPEDVTTPADVAVKMSALSLGSPVAIVSGRTLESLKPKVLFPAAFMIGNHGVDGLAFSKRLLPKARTLSEKWYEQIHALEKQGHFVSRMQIENKEFSLTIHYRLCKNRALACRQIERLIEKLEPAPRIIRGKFLYNILPPYLPHKGDAVKEILRLEKLNQVFFMGDDITDEDVFRVAKPKWVTVRVGKSKKSQAKFYVPSFREVPRLLDLLLSVSRK